MSFQILPWERFTSLIGLTRKVAENGEKWARCCKRVGKALKESGQRDGEGGQGAAQDGHLLPTFVLEMGIPGLRV